ncbi:hypothetical protein ADU59_00755 (plasmid) [Pararhizobium polonicum]|uniref:Solute-binding protein family 3/N-terminal domain-containing protein n=1 Tax=Pararhizobium polonicum TaxID=1612624 RepID=A0A1C7P8L9_9HYPH|nr:hypothetical protein ADU59_00755 [Pararhizobium polonicum]
MVTFTLLSAAPVLADGPLKSALDGNAPPYAQPKMDGSVEGLTVDLTKEIAKRLGREITIDAMAFSAILPALQAGTYDMLSVPLTATSERSEAFLLTEGIWSADMDFLLPANGADVTDFSQLKGKVISTNKGNAYEKWAREKTAEYGWTVESYGSLSDAAQAVTAGRADAAIVGVAIGLTIAKKNPALKVSELTIKTNQYYSYPVARTNPELRKQLDMAIECIKSDGTAAKLYEKWLGAAPHKASLEVTPQPGYGPVGMGNYDPTTHALTCK